MIDAPLSPRAERSASLDFDARLVRPLLLGDVRIVARAMLYLAPVLGVLAVLAIWVAKHVGVLPRETDPSSTPWLAVLVLGAAVWATCALAASVLQGVR